MSPALRSALGHPAPAWAREGTGRASGAAGRLGIPRLPRSLGCAGQALGALSGPLNPIPTPVLSHYVQRERNPGFAPESLLSSLEPIAVGPETGLGSVLSLPGEGRENWLPFWVGGGVLLGVARGWPHREAGVEALLSAPVPPPGGGESPLVDRAGLPTETCTCPLRGGGA